MLEGIGDGRVDSTIAAVGFDLACNWPLCIFFDPPSVSSPLLIGIHRNRQVGLVWL